MVQKSDRQLSPQQWVMARKREALDLLARSEVLCRQLFTGGDLTGYAALLSRLHQYDYRNLLLIYDQFPEATCLASFAAWKALFSDSSTKVLKDSAFGKGINLLAPFTEHGNGKYYLVWHRVLQFDISQTNVTRTFLPDSPYLHDQDHLKLLSDALRSALGYLHQKSLLLIQSNNPTLPPQLVYRITSEAVVIRRRETYISRVQILTEAMGRLSAAKAGLLSEHHTLFAQCFSFCLFQIWGLQDLCHPLSFKTQIQAVPESVQPLFLDRLQRSVRLVEETVACAYRLDREEVGAQPLDDDIASLFDEKPFARS